MATNKELAKEILDDFNNKFPMAGDEPEQCSNCLFGQDAKTSFAKKSIECRRYPPAQEAGVQQPENSPFPIVAVDGWCGEYKKGANYGKE